MRHIVGKTLVLYLLVGCFPGCTWFSAPKETKGVVSDGKIVDVSTLEAFDKIKDETSHLILDFHAKWCGPCRFMGSLFKDVIGDYENLKVVKVDVDTTFAKPLIDKYFGMYKVSGVPFIVYFKDGKVTHHHVGAVANKEDLKKKINQHLGL